MTTTPADLRLTSTPTRVAELLLPTVISLLIRGPASASTFSTLLHSRPEPPASPSPGTDVTASGGEPAAVPGRRSTESGWSPGTRVTAGRKHQPATPRPPRGARQATS